MKKHSHLLNFSLGVILAYFLLLFLSIRGYEFEWLQLMTIVTFDLIIYIPLSAICYFFGTKQAKTKPTVKTAIYNGLFGLSCRRWLVTPMIRYSFNQYSKS